MEKITITIDGRKIETDKGKTVLQVARENGFDIPTFCNQPFIEPTAACRICVVEVKNRKNLPSSCSTPAEDGMEIYTASKRVLEARRIIIQLLLANHRTYCPTCDARNKCLLLEYSRRYNVKEIEYLGKIRDSSGSNDRESIVRRDQSKCILCGRCVEICEKIVGVEAISFKKRGFNSEIGSAFDKKLHETRCISCGQCVNGCPVGALSTRLDLDDVLKELENPERKVIFQTAPSIRVALGEEFNMPAGSIVTGKMVAAIRRLGAYKVFQTDFGADVTIMEEGTEFLRRLSENDYIPMFTSCCPAWQKYIEQFYPDLLPHLSSCKSPQAMEGTLIKNWYAKNNGLTREEVVVVSVMPCSAKKWEITRPGCAYKEIADVDYVITTRELADLIKLKGIDFVNLSDENYDDILGEASGAGEIFGATGGVMEAALRTVVEKATGETLEKPDFTEIRGMKGVREATVNLCGKNVNILVISGLANAKPFLDEIRAGKSKYHFIEVMACPGGCINGGGMPFYHSTETIRKRYEALFADDETKKIRKSHENPSVKKLYDEFLGEPNGHMSHELLHTPYIDRSYVI